MTTLKGQVKLEELRKGPEKKETPTRGRMRCPRSQGEEGKGIDCEVEKLTKLKECEVPFLQMQVMKEKVDPWTVAGGGRSQVHLAPGGSELCGREGRQSLLSEKGRVRRGGSWKGEWDAGRIPKA